MEDHLLYTELKTLLKKGEIAHYEQFLLFQQCFLKSSAAVRHNYGITRGVPIGINFSFQTTLLMICCILHVGNNVITVAQSVATRAFNPGGCCEFEPQLGQHSFRRLTSIFRLHMTEKLLKTALNTNKSNDNKVSLSHILTLHCNINNSEPIQIIKQCSNKRGRSKMAIYTVQRLYLVGAFDLCCDILVTRYIRIELINELLINR